MLTHRNGAAVAICDRCFRPQPEGETWVKAPGFPVAAAVDSVVDAKGKDHAVPKVQPAQPGHLCPECAAASAPDDGRRR